MRVLLPMPGSHPNKVSDPGTNPPPSTRFSSPLFVFKRICCKAEISLMRSGVFLRLLGEVLVLQATFSTFCTISSAIVFHSLQELHCPCHFACSAPQF